LKPENILVELRADMHHFLLTDFGISKILTDEYLASKAFQIRNLRGLTISYAAPDAMKRFRQKQIGTPNLEKAGDVYSLSCLMFFLMNQTAPWEL
jgi:serine/threonine protein kinase